MFAKILPVLFMLNFFALKLLAQYDVPLYTAYTTNAARAKLTQRLVSNSITRNLSLPLTDSTEENWEEAFDAMEVMQFHNAFTESKVRSAFQNIQSRSISFQRALLELAYSNYPGKFAVPAMGLLDHTFDPKIYAMCAEYLIQHQKDHLLNGTISQKTLSRFRDSVYINPILNQLVNRLENRKLNPAFSIHEVMKEILNKKFLPNQIVMYSFQRKNRDYPGMVLIRDAGGHFVEDSPGHIFHIPQLARSITDLPGYLTNGNTPQGIFKMYGFQVSMSNFIGPTANVQMGMPVELSLQKFFGDSAITDSVWTIEDYQKLLPEKLKAYLPLYDCYYAGLAGRREIIAHGTTIDPEFYLGKPYYPLTPTEGCLCTKEIWDGKRLESDQQKLVNGLLKAGGATGYCVVIELDDRQAPVTFSDVSPYLPKK